MAVRARALAAALAGFIGLGCSQAWAQADGATFSLWPKWGPYLDVGGLLGTQRNIGGVDLFVLLAVGLHLAASLL